MSTRGAYGLRWHEQDKVSYNHSDSYPEGLGKEIAEVAAGFSIDDLKNVFYKIEMVNGTSRPNKEQQRFLSAIGIAWVGNDWYNILRQKKGKLLETVAEALIHGKSFMTDESLFIKDSLFCEYAYIINLDSECLEFWVGFQKKPDTENRYGTDENDGYYPCRMIASIQLNSCKTVESFIKMMDIALTRYMKENEESN